MNKMSIIRPCVLFLFLLSSLHSYSQQDSDTARGIPKSLFLAEVLGHGRGFASANYERMFKINNNKHFLYSFRIGAGYTPGYTYEDNKQRHKGIVTFPLVASLMAGGKLGYAQLSVGYSYSFGGSEIDSTAKPPDIYQKNEPA